jgi:hypothetical protein
MKLLLFESVHRVMEAERELAAASVPYQLLPVPTEYSSECGMCIGVSRKDAQAARTVLGRLVCSVVDSPKEAER